MTIYIVYQCLEYEGPIAAWFYTTRQLAEDRLKLVKIRDEAEGVSSYVYRISETEVRSSI